MKFLILKSQQTLPNGIPSNDPSLPDLDTPLYVLVNSNTASAAEVLAAALKVINDECVTAAEFFDDFFHVEM